MDPAAMLIVLSDGEEPDEPSGDVHSTGQPEDESRRADGRAMARILVVEDDYLVAMEIEAGLAEAGYEVIGPAATAEDAVRLAEAERPRLAVMDIRLAGERDGVDAALEIHRRLGIRSIFASAHGDSEVQARAYAARPLAWVAKPYRVSLLVAAVGRAIASLEREAEPRPEPKQPG